MRFRVSEENWIEIREVDVGWLGGNNNMYVLQTTVCSFSFLIEKKVGTKSVLLHSMCGWTDSACGTYVARVFSHIIYFMWSGSSPTNHQPSVVAPKICRIPTNSYDKISSHSRKNKMERTNRSLYSIERLSTLGDAQQQQQQQHKHHLGLRNRKQS